MNHAVITKKVKEALRFVNLVDFENREIKGDVRWTKATSSDCPCDCK